MHKKCSKCHQKLSHDIKEGLKKAKAVKKEVKRDVKIAKVKSHKGKAKVEKVMKEFKAHKLHSGSKKGPKVSNPKQAIAIALSEARRMKKK